MADQNVLKEVQITRVFGGGRVVIPKEVRKFLEIADGDRLVWMVDEESGLVCIRKVSERKFREW